MRMTIRDDDGTERVLKLENVVIGHDPGAPDDDHADAAIYAFTGIDRSVDKRAFVTVNTIDVRAQDPDRFVRGLVEAFERAAKKPRALSREVHPRHAMTTALADQMADKWRAPSYRKRQRQLRRENRK